MASDSSVPPPPPPPPTEAPRPQESKKVLAGILAILLGGLGVHKFVLGMTTPGIILVVVFIVCLVASPFTCGISLVVPGIIGLIEGIIYLTKSDEEFIRLYQGPNPKQWF